MPRLLVVIASTRPGRVGPSVAEWFTGCARAHGGFDVDVADLADADLPILDEPNHPRLHQYTKDHTKTWSAQVEAADAAVFVSPEYNFFAPPALVNAIDYLNSEWRYLPVALVTYGGVSGGLRSAQTIKQLVTSLRMFPIPEAVVIPFVGQHLHDGRFEANQLQNESASAVLDELAKLQRALGPLRRA